MLNFILFRVGHFPTLVSLCHLILFETIWVLVPTIAEQRVSDSVEQGTESLGRGGRPGRAETWYPRMIL